MTLSHRIFSIVNTLVWIVVSAFVLLLISTTLPQLQLPQLSYQAFVVTSASMEPTIMTGDFIFTQKQQSYAVEDIVTYQSPNEPMITHRIIGIDTADQNRFITKGDNNEDPDTVTLATEDIKGKFAFRFPAVGYALVYSKTPLGLATLIGLPVALMLIEWGFFTKTAVSSTTDTKRNVPSSTQSSASPDAL
jgi:signal peptidase